MEPWQNAPLSAGSLVALASGVVATLAMGYGLQSWVDSRIERQLVPLKAQMAQFEVQLETYNNRRSAQYDILKSNQETLLSYFKERRDAR